MNPHRLPQPAPWLCLFAVLFWQAAATAAPKQGEVYRMAAPAPWVVPVTPDYRDVAPDAELSNGSAYLLLDRQIRLGEKGDEHYQHVVVQVANAAGVEEQSEIGLSVDPSYQTLDIHALRVVRQGVASDQRQGARITVLAQESELEQHIYNGGYTVNILLSDVRAGDVVEYAYTVRSRELLYPGHYARRMDVGWSVPMRWQRVRLLHAPGRALRHRFTASPVEPKVSERGGMKELFFEWRDLPALVGDDDTPGWYWPWPVLEFSDFPDWATVGDGVSSLYVLKQRPRPRLDAAVKAIESKGGTPQQKTLRALQMVQDDIRYTSISIGRGSHTPTDPETILERQFGDCKDKSLLLSTLLGRLGIDARPALVHSERGRLLNQSLPSPYAFDHVVSRVRIGNASYWLDGTSYKQDSPLEKIAPADFGLALPIGVKGVALEKIPRPVAGEGKRTVLTHLDLSKGLFAPATIRVETRYTGSSADSMRDKLARKPVSQRTTDYLNYYARYYPGVKSAGPVTVKDDPATNTLTTQERYTLEKTFEKDDDGDSYYWLQSDELSGYGSKLKSSVRSSPLALAYPDAVRQVLTVKLPDEWNFKAEKTAIDNPAFRYRSEVSHKGDTLTLTFDYQALADHVTPKALDQYIADREKLDNDLSYRLWRDTTPENDAAATPERSAGMAPAPFLTGFFALCLAGWLARQWLYRLDPAPRAAAPGAPQGFMGWLLLPAFGIAISPFLLLTGLKELAGFIDADSWHGLPQAVPEALAPFAQPVLLALIVLSCGVWVISVLTAVLFFTTRTSAPAAYMALLWSALLLELATYLAVVQSGLDDTLKPTDLIRPLLTALVWTAYMRRSERVKATFVTRLAPVPAPPAPPSAALRADGGEQLHPGHEVRPQDGLAGDEQRAA